jgi:hypothetical protein
MKYSIVAFENDKKSSIVNIGSAIAHDPIDGTSILPSSNDWYFNVVTGKRWPKLIYDDFVKSKAFIETDKTIEVEASEDDCLIVVSLPTTLGLEWKLIADKSLGYSQGIFDRPVCMVFRSKEEFQKLSAPFIIAAAKKSRELIIACKAMNRMSLCWEDFEFLNNESRDRDILKRLFAQG